MAQGVTILILYKGARARLILGKATKPLSQASDLQNTSFGMYSWLEEEIV